MNNDLYKAILSMDAYNRSYDQGLVLTGSLIGNASITEDSSSLGFMLNSNGEPILDNNGAPIRKDVNIGFYGIAYEYNGEVIIAYRGTDDASLDSKWNTIVGDEEDSKDSEYGFSIASRDNSVAAQSEMAFRLWRGRSGLVDKSHVLPPWMAPTAVAAYTSSMQ